MTKISQEQKTKIIRLIHAIIPDCRIILFGSFARNTQGNGSDIDLALDAKRKLTISELGEVKGVLENSYLPYSFDIVDIHTISASMQESIKQEGVIWIE
ncbi:MAG TPA: nucleotidyltransferase domain-containing protein [Candidatus Babeliales bacterium]|jgi:predicted nucleotidyltransferase|nr:nucleotidyltransferase domain-containing protein [Candidatus Babeliales bacterium]